MTVGDLNAVQHVTVAADDADIRLDRWFKRHIPDLTFGQLSKILRKGEVRVDGKRAEAKTRLLAGQDIRIPPLSSRLMPSKTTQEKAAEPLTDDEIALAQSMVLHKDKDVIALNKPPGLAVQGGSGQTRHVDRLLPALRFEREHAPRLVHRLDKDTSGVLLLGRTAASAAALTKAFRERTAQKTYWALVIGRPEIAEGKINQPIEKLPGRHGEKMVASEEGKAAVTVYRILDSVARKASLLEMQPLTGRTHQLRVHAALMGTPIVGDGKYGGQDAFLTGAISRKMHLHARHIQLTHPNGGTLDVTAPMPHHMEESLSMLGLSPDLED